MITLEQFKEMEKGTIFWVCAGGNANNLVGERFHSVAEVEERQTDTTIILTYSGGSAFQTFLHNGDGLFLDKELAVEYMTRRAKHLHDRRTESLKTQIKKLQLTLDDHLNSEPTTDYTFIDMTDIPEPEGWLYDKTVSNS